MTYEPQNESLISILWEKSPRRRSRYYISPVKQGSCGTQRSKQSSDNMTYELQNESLLSILWEKSPRR